MSYRIFLILIFQPKLARVGLSYFHLRTLELKLQKSSEARCGRLLER